VQLSFGMSRNIIRTIRDHARTIPRNSTAVKQVPCIVHLSRKRRSTRLVPTPGLRMSRASLASVEVASLPLRESAASVAWRPSSADAGRKVEEREVVKPRLFRVYASCNGFLHIFPSTRLAASAQAKDAPDDTNGVGVHDWHHLAKGKAPHSSRHVRPHTGQFSELAILGGDLAAESLSHGMTEVNDVLRTPRQSQWPQYFAYFSWLGTGERTGVRVPFQEFLVGSKDLISLRASEHQFSNGHLVWSPRLPPRVVPQVLPAPLLDQPAERAYVAWSEFHRISNAQLIHRDGRKITTPASLRTRRALYGLAGKSGIIFHREASVEHAWACFQAICRQ